MVQMMSRSSRQKNRTAKGPKSHQWKLIDDRSGFELMSSNARIDHRGRITSVELFDPIHYTELPIVYPEDKPLPYTRPEPMDHIISGNYNMVNNVPATYLSNWYSQVTPTALTEITPSSNPNMNFSNYLPNPTFGPPWPNSGNTIVDLPTTGRYKSWGDSYDYFTSDEINDWLSPQDIRIDRIV